MLAPTLLLIPFLCGTQAAANNWEVACKGECSYDLPDSAVSGTLKIFGASSAVSDITPAGGWTILDCDTDSLAQSVRLACQTSACEHLFEGQGAIDTVVRLPETCGASPFARVAGIQVDPDQTLPSDVAATITTIGNLTSMVFLLSIDTDFAAADSTKTGPISFSLEGYNFPTTTDAGNSTTRRGLKVRDNITAFNDTNSVSLPVLSIDQTFPLFSASVDCTDFSASVSASFETKIDATVSIGLIAAGTVIPPEISEFAVFGGLDASVLATLGLTASATGSISTGKISLYTYSLAGINFPGIFTLGPAFTIYGEIDADLSAVVDLSVDLAYTLNTTAYLPSSAAPSNSGSTPADSTLVVSAVPTATLNATVTPILTPELSLGLTALGIIDATVALDIPGSLSVALNVDGNGSATGTVGTGSSGSGSASGSIDACIDIGAAVGVNLEASGSLSLLGLSATETYPLYTNSWDLYNKCASANGSTRRAAERRTTGISCPTSSSVTSLEQIIDEIISAF
ncbi:USP domain-containing protein [Mycena sanguinolenta]|uniref:USP domain-containing protein n=1 Tax=Mycena sanguinolenta TaxID=230812 RepID=A0A8H6ZFL9_9AGAR|nr:USP domain-containing protein [Mycena sanguinolenta]